MKSKELFTIRFGEANKSGTGFLLEEINVVLLVCAGRMLFEEFELLVNACHNQIREQKAVACITDFALMDTDLVEEYMIGDFHKNTLAKEAGRLAIVLPQKVENGQLVQHNWPTPKEHELTTFYTNNLSDALSWATTHNQHQSSNWTEGKEAVMNFVKDKLKFQHD